MHRRPPACSPHASALSSLFFVPFFKLLPLQPLCKDGSSLRSLSFPEADLVFVLCCPRNNDYSPRFKVAAVLQSAKELAERHRRHQPSSYHEITQSASMELEGVYGAFSLRATGQGPTIPQSGSSAKVPTAITPLLVAEGCQSTAAFLRVNDTYDPKIHN